MAFFQLLGSLESGTGNPFLRQQHYVSVLATLGVLFTSSLGGYSFARIDYPGRNTIFLMYLSTMMIPFAVIMIPLFVQMRLFGWVNSLAALIVPGLFSAWGTFLMRQFMMAIPKELEEAAEIDGCNHLRIYAQIILPLCKPVMATLAIFTFMGFWERLPVAPDHDFFSRQKDPAIGASRISAKGFPQYPLASGYGLGRSQRVANPDNLHFGPEVLRARYCHFRA